MSILEAIEQIDGKLDIMRLGFEEAPPDKKDKWRKAIDEQLDLRLKQMRLRDAPASNSPPAKS